jgi:hypothetical protein
VAQWDKEDCADLGMIKADIVRLRVFAALKDYPG